MTKQIKWLFAATMAMLAIAWVPAQAALTTLSGPIWPPPGSSGLETVQFAVAEAPMAGASSARSALGAHEYKTSPLLSNDGVSTFFAPTGTYLAEDRANWSFDFGYDCSALLNCRVKLEIDSDPSSATNFVTIFDQLVGTGPGALGESWNLDMNFLEGMLGSHDANANETRDFRFMVSGNDPGSPSKDLFLSAVSDIRVVVGRGGAVVPEPGSMALLFAAVVVLFLMNRKNNNGNNSGPMLALAGTRRRTDGPLTFARYGTSPQLAM